MASRAELKRASKFRTTCDRCGVWSPRAATRFTVEKWMSEHEAQHRAADEQEAGR